MKRFQIFLLAFILSASAFAQKEFIDKLGNIDGVTSVYVSKTMLKLLPQLDVKELDLKKISQKMDGVQILTADNLNAVKKLKTNALSYLQTLVAQSYTHQGIGTLSNNTPLSAWVQSYA